MLEPKYNLLIVSYIPLYRENDSWYTLDLWVRDLMWNKKFVNDICLLSPQSTVNIDKSAKLPSNIRIVTFDEVSSTQKLEKLIEDYAVIQLSAGRPSWECRKDFRVIKLAKSKNKCIICGISSDRAKTTVLNSVGKPFLKKMKARIRAWSILNTSRKLALASDGLFLVGSGLTKRLSFNHKALHIDIASWITSEDILSEDSFQNKIKEIRSRKQLKLCVATRLEAMKGVKIAIEALGCLKQTLKDNVPLLFIYGSGPERDKLQSLCRRLDLEEQVNFMGNVPYGLPFFKEICKYEVMLLTNLNDEQPRLIFDALSQGMVPICPDSDAYLALGLNEDWLYKTGDYHSLFEKMQYFNKKDFLIDSLSEAKSLARKYTIDSMHSERSKWIAHLINHD